MGKMKEISTSLSDIGDLLATANPDVDYFEVTLVAVPVKNDVAAPENAIVFTQSNMKQVEAALTQVG